jgi:hypothetical protein
VVLVTSKSIGTEKEKVKEQHHLQHLCCKHHHLAEEKWNAIHNGYNPPSPSSVHCLYAESQTQSA